MIIYGAIGAIVGELNPYSYCDAFDNAYISAE